MIAVHVATSVFLFLGAVTFAWENNSDAVMGFALMLALNIAGIIVDVYTEDS